MHIVAELRLFSHWHRLAVGTGIAVMSVTVVMVNPHCLAFGVRMHAVHLSCHASQCVQPSSVRSTLLLNPWEMNPIAHRCDPCAAERL